MAFIVPITMFTQEVIHSTITAQLPRDVARLVHMVTVEADHTVRIKFHDKRVFVTKLSMSSIEGVQSHCKLPERFVDHLCLVA